MNRFKVLINARYGEDTCKEGMNYCKFNKICNQVDKRLNKVLYFTLEDEGGTQNFQIDWNLMFLTGSYFGEGPLTCYLGVFDHGLRGYKDSETIIIGNIFTKNYYLVYDMSPLELGEDYIQIGFGL